MTRSKDKDVVPSPDRPRRALLLELRGEKTEESGGTTTASTELFAALSMEEVIAYVRTRQPSIEVMEVKMLGRVQILSSSEHLK